MTIDKTRARTVAREAAAHPPSQCANLDENWKCRECGCRWFGTLTDRGCPHCGAGIDLIDLDPDKQEAV